MHKMAHNTHRDHLNKLFIFLKNNRGRRTFLEHEIKGMFKDMGFSVPKGVFIKKGMGLTSLKELSFPLVAKVSSSHIVSKTETKGIRLGLKNMDELNTAVNELLQIDDAEGVLVEEMAQDGLEVIVGGTIDEQFGPVVMFGLGGIFVELFKDVAFGLTPLKRDEALWLIRQIKGYRLLEGFRGRPPLDKEGLLDMIVIVSEIMETGLIREIDLNPIALYPEGAIILDAKMRTI